MTLYDEIRNEEKRIAGLQKEIQHLQENGFNVEGELPVLAREARRLLRDKYHKVVGYIPRITSGGLEGHVNELLVQRTWRLKYNKEERERFNEGVENLTEAMPGASGLRKYHFLHISEFEGSILWCALLGLIVGSVGGYLLPDDPSYRANPVKAAGIVIGVIGLICGLASAVHDISYVKRTIKQIKQNASYIDEVLAYDTL